MAEVLGPITTEAMLFYSNNNVYEVVVKDYSQPFFLSFLFEVEKEKQPVVAHEFMTKNGISITEELPEKLIEVILENL